MNICENKPISRTSCELGVRPDNNVLDESNLTKGVYLKAQRRKKTAHEMEHKIAERHSSIDSGFDGLENIEPLDLEDLGQHIPKP